MYGAPHPEQTEMSLMKHLVRITALALAAALLPAQDGEAQSIGFGAQGSYDFVGDGFFGAGVRADVGFLALPIGIQGTFDYFFGDEADPPFFDDYWRIGVNGIYEFLPVNVGISPYVGAGLAHVNADNFDETGWQVLAGASFGFEALLTPFAEVRYIDTGDVDADFLISVGLHF